MKTYLFGEDAKKANNCRMDFPDSLLFFFSETHSRCKTDFSLFRNCIYIPFYPYTAVRFQALKR